MKASDDAATNLFVRMTSLAVEDGSRRLENLCTESLAWFLLQSQELRQRFLNLIGHSGAPSEFEFNTQEFCLSKTGGDGDAAKNYFDLIAVSEKAREVFIVEAKASTRFRPDQLPKYRKAAARNYPGYRIIIVSLSPHAEKPIGSDLHVQWSQVAAEVAETKTPAKLRDLLEQFTAFLEEKGLTLMKLKPVAPGSLKEWNNVVTHQDQFKQLLKLLFNNADLKGIYGKSKEPKSDYDAKNNRSWLGIHTSGRNPGFYAGVAVMHQGQPALWLEMWMESDQIPDAKELPVTLQAPYQAAMKYHKPGTDHWANAGHADGGSITLVFVREVDRSMDSGAIVDWFRNTTVQAAEFAKNRWGLKRTR